jgi:hypothetical protein
MLIFNFIKYIEWPAEASGSGEFVIGVYGDDNVYEQLNKLYAARSIKGQSARVVNMSAPSDLRTAHIIYVADNKSNDFDEIKSKFASQPTLIITDKMGLGKKGSLINFKEVGGKLKFEINQASFDASNLKVSTQLKNMGIVI